MKASYTILVLGEDPARSKFIESVLQQSGCQVLDADRREPLPDLIVCDARAALSVEEAAESCGAAAARAISAGEGNDPSPAVPILMVLAAGISGGEAENVFRGAPVEVLTAPFEPPRLAAAAARIIERHRLGRALRKAEERYAVLAENANDIIFTVDLDAVFLSLNRAAERISGYSREELVGSHFSKVVAPECWELVARKMREKIAGGGDEVTVYEAEILTKGDRRRVMLEINSRPIEKDGVPVGILGIARDITERHEAERALRESEERFKAQYKAIPIPTTTWKRAGAAPGEDDFVLADFNEAALEISDGRITEMLGMKASLFFEHAPHMFEDLRRCFKERSVVKRETPYVLRTTGVAKQLDTTCVFIAPDTVMAHYRDITERRQFEEALRRSQQQYELLVNSIEGVVWEAEAESLTFTFVSREAERMLGYPLEQWFEPDFWSRHLHPDDRPGVLEASRAAIGESKNHKLEYRMIAADGREVWVRDIVAVDAADKTSVRLRGLMIDITERKLAEVKLRWSEANLAAAQRLTHLGSFEIALTDLRRVDNNKVYWSDEVYRIFGYEPGEVEISVSRYFDQMVHPDDRRRVWREFAAAVGRERKLDVEYRAILPNGVERYHHGLAEVVHDSQSDVPLKLIGTVQDITERRQAEQSIAEANERAIREYERLLERISELAESLGSARDLPTIYRALYAFASASVPSDGFFISLYDPKKNVRVPAYARSEGEETDVSLLPVMEMSGSPNSRAVSTGNIVIENDFQRAMEGKPIVNIGLDKDPRLPQSCLVVPMSIMGRIVGAVEVQSCLLGAYTPEHAIAMRMAANLVANAIENVRLLEQERQSAEQLRQAQKLESVGRLAGGIAHDFNNMLTAINGYSGLILRKLEKDSPLRPKIEEIKKAGERSASLTQQLLAFSRQQVLKPKVLDINEVVIDTSKLLQRLIGEDIQLNIIPNPKIGRVQVDPVQLTQVIMNLAVNARDAMPDGGSLTIETANIYLDKDYADHHLPTKPGSYVMLAITDTGRGMDKETLQHIFEPFFTTKEVGKGTGLGLSTVYGIVKQSGGYIWVYSEPGQGTTFKIYLPRVDEDARNAQGSPGDAFEDAPGGDETILLVEDEESVRKMTRQMLEACGYHIIEARNGQEALAVCSDPGEKIDLLITDVVMPKMSGRELGEKLAQLDRRIPQLFMSGYTDDAIIRQGMITEEMNFIQKPFTFEDLTRKVREMLDS